MAIERQARFEPERISRAEPDRFDIRARACVENRFEQLPRAAIFREQLEAIFSGVTGPRRETDNVCDFPISDAEACDVSDREIREGRQYRDCGRSLHRYQRGCVAEIFELRAAIVDFEEPFAI